MKDINTALKEGIRFLAEAQDSDGFWRERFNLRHGESTYWATAYIGRLIKPIAQKLVEQSVERILDSQNDDGGWSYNAISTSDADSTINALLFVGNINQRVVQRGLNFLLKHQHKNGGISTYTQENIKRMGYSGNGWSSPHVCVTALGTQILSGEELVRAKNFLLSTQKEDGSFPAYWWASDLYPTLEVIKGLSKRSEEIKKYFRQYMPSSSFELALKIQGSLLTAQKVNNDITTLLELQLVNGNWPSSPILRIPRPNLMPDKDLRTSEIVSDEKSLFSTVNAVIALQKYVGGTLNNN